MPKYYVGQEVRIGGRLGAIMTIDKIEANGNMTLSSPGCKFYYSPGDCILYPVNKVHYEQLRLF